MPLQSFVKVLESYRGREKTMRTLQYGLLLISPLASERVGESFKILSSQLGMTRVVLRLFDDLPMLQYSLSTGTGHKDEDVIVRTLRVLNNVVDQIYFPVEHFAWARDMKMVRGNSAALWNASLVLWGLSLLLTIIRSLRQVSLIRQQRKGANRDRIEKLNEQHDEELLTVIMQASDLLNALNWMPKRPWANPFPAWQVRTHTWRPWYLPFPQWQVGLLGLISSLIGFRKMMSSQ
ncbi:peroxisomal membrane protein 11C-like isoform X1 [Penaeus monodon]|uniref:peroxisomal membrane protein 11C-like isoform X1 n=1 Tax=Penaeus monodon TaxID=6687 RepID=UPI0018A78666|nr:peroxisomal membrane protein 11C-like isoform X1 [Penaeus monodon]XP_037799078.1 peroxisomal membrane protein 11C-like isoform X1 [Penaeus monodon]XP_037799087.1 peroxisomal membrane protein 11C-like isoform X1 [Penaeus monodon]XP_037799095.1 peroxisomal membrane protein 11C-like isoform X1 [Penaeus monodon]